VVSHPTCVRCFGDSGANALEDLRTLPFNAPFQCLCPCKLDVLPVLPCSSSEFTWPLDLSRVFVAPCCCCSYSCCPKPRSFLRGCVYCKWIFAGPWSGSGVI
jgi:hypothetical protein